MLLQKKKLKKEQCKSCLNNIRSCEKAFMCEACKHWYHLKCVGVSTKLYEILQTDEGKHFHWFCDDCDSVVMMELCNIAVRCDKIESELMNEQLLNNDQRVTRVEAAMSAKVDEIDRKMAKMDCELNKVKMKVDNQLVTNKNDIGNISTKVTESIQGQEGQWCDVVKRQVDVTLEKVTDNIQEVRNSLSETRAQAAEQWDKESRRNNLILYNVPESTQPRAEDRNKADIDFCIQLFNRTNALHVGVSNEDLIQVFRLGKRGDDIAPTRPLLIQFASYTFKNFILESLSKLKHAEQKYKNVIVAHDMTKTERE